MVYPLAQGGLSKPDMQDFLDTAFSLPTVIFTVSTIFLLGFWTLTTLIGAGADALDDLDFDFDAETDVDVDVSADAGLLRSALEFLGIGSMPLLIALNLESIFAWATSMIVMTIIGDASGVVALVIGLAVAVGAFLVGVFITRAIARRFSHVFTPTLASKRRDFVGSVCTITTERVAADFGQAEVRDGEGGSLIVQVRCMKQNDLARGDNALIFDLDRGTGFFQVSPDRSLAG